MGRVNTNVLCDEVLKDKAKKQNINLSKTLEEALRAKLDHHAELEALELERKAHLKKARDLKHVIDERKAEIKEIKKTMGDEEKRMEKALKLCGNFMKKGEITDEEYDRAAKKFHVNVFDLRKNFEKMNL